jgi:hypothetical protein
MMGKCKLRDCKSEVYCMCTMGGGGRKGPELYHSQITTQYLSQQDCIISEMLIMKFTQFKNMHNSLEYEPDSAGSRHRRLLL